MNKKSSSPMKVLPKGTVLFHGTDSDHLEEEHASLNGPAWLSNAKEVAIYFAGRSGGWGGVKRVIEYTLSEDVELHLITSQREMIAFADKYDIELAGVEPMRESAENAGIPGWVIEGNYPEGDDILIVNTSCLDYVATHPLK